MKKFILPIIGAIFVIFVIAFNIYYYTRETIETAIDEYEDQDYTDAIVVLNRLSKTADYDTGEKIFYYKCKSINKLAKQLEEKYDDELEEISLEKRTTKDYEKTRRELNEDLDEINKDINGDLTLELARKSSRIISRGKFYDEFISKYKGSSYIEDLDYEELEKLAISHPENLLSNLINFYNKYPNTNYISHIVKILFDHLKDERVSLKSNHETLINLVVAYGKRHPTSPEINKIFTSTGDNVNLRNSPGIEGKLVGKIKLDEILIQLEKSMDSSQIGDTRDYWYRVTNLAGIKGWIFGKFLSQIDITKFKSEEIKEVWAIEEDFTEWNDSNTPKNWSHIPESDPGAISFKAENKNKVLSINSPKGKSCGLYNRFNSSRAFKIMAKAKYVKGESITIFALVLPGNRSYSIKLMEEKIDVAGRAIPLHTSDWHEYLLESEDGNFATLSINGEVISGRIEPVLDKDFQLRGLFCMSSSKDHESQGEMEFIRIK